MAARYQEKRTQLAQTGVDFNCDRRGVIAVVDSERGLEYGIELSIVDQAYTLA